MHWNCFRCRFSSLSYRWVLPTLLLTLVTGTSCDRTGVLTLGTGPDGDRIISLAGISGDGSVIVGTIPFIDEKRDSGLSFAQETQAFRWTAGGGIEPLGFIGPADFNESVAGAISANGRVILGYSSSPEGNQSFRWTRLGGFAPLETPSDSINFAAATGLSSDGSVIIGRAMTKSPSRFMAFRWTERDGYQFFNVPSLEKESAWATDISNDGRVIVGLVSMAGDRTFRWTAETGAVVLDDFTENCGSTPFDISGDGSTIIGQLCRNSNDPAPFRWTEAEGFVTLGGLPGERESGSARATSYNGSVIVGTTRINERDSTAFIWDAVNGMRTILSLLSEEDLALLEGWSLESADLLSADGRTVAGLGRNPEGNRDIWVVRLPLF
ncbi:MAG: hypothetical protein MI923_09290 [Phycisphaerales bacterium]|nr:hypothetical protein [Phycisphaerales bacterium]